VANTEQQRRVKERTNIGGSSDAGADEHDTARSSGLGPDGEPFTHYQDSARTHRQDAETIAVPLKEEDLTATRRDVDRGAVRVEKDVVAEEQTLEVPVTEERVNVQRRAVDRAVTDTDTTFEEGAIEVPVRGEEVVAEKRARVTEEVEISKEPVARTERVSGTVRREEVRVDDATTNVTDAGRSARGRRG
jgi:uncharacterized protein (TIGR02271 family)